MNERPLSHDEEDIIALAYWVVNQHQTLPDQMVERHGMILDFYLESCPTQANAIISMLTNFNEEDWDG